MTPTISKSSLFSIYNKAAAAARAGKIDPSRTNRALGILLSKDPEARLGKYQASTKGCTCEDHRRGHTCKHIIARWLQWRAS